MALALDGTGLSVEGLHYVVGTGYGRVRLPFPKEQIRSEILCHGLGAHAMFAGGALVAGVLAAARSGRGVINLSLGTTRRTRLLEDILERVRQLRHDLVVESLDHGDHGDDGRDADDDAEHREQRAQLVGLERLPGHEQDLAHVAAVRNDSFHAFGQLFLCHLQSFIDQLPGEE